MALRWLVTVILGLVLAGCTTAPRAPDDCFRVRLPDAQGLTALLEAGRRSELDTALVCLAREVAGRPESRAPFVAWVREHGADIANLGGYQAWLKATQLAYERLPGVELPAEWAAGGLRLESATPSPDARYLAAHLTGPDGKAYTGWWAPDGGARGLVPGAGFDLTWHPELPQFAYLVKGPGEREHTLQIIGAGTEPASRSAVISGFAAVRYPLWAKQQQEIMLIADPAAEPREIAYSLKHDRVYTETYRGRFKPFAPGNHPLIPTWVARPWNPAAELPVWEVSQHLSYPNPGGSAYYFGPVPVGERRALVWSPRATVAAAAAWQGNEVMVTVLRPAWDARENEPIYRLQGRHIAIYDDGITTFTAGGNSVTAINHLTGEKADWTVPGEILGLQLTRDTLFIVQSGRVGRVLLREPVQVK